jgi:DNA repair exonuclease SbcCD ATPase subunit
MRGFLIAATLSVLATSAFADANSETCQQKQDRINQQIEYAQAHNNTAQLKGLQTALEQAKRNCSEASLEKRRQSRITNAQAKVNAREADLKKAQDKGDGPKKIASRQRKLDEAREELKRAQDPVGP